MEWGRIVLSQADIEADRILELQTKLSMRWVMRGAPSEAGVFRKGKMLYFSPKAVELLEDLLTDFALAECPAPLRKGLDILIARDLAAIPFASE